jgi:hypothetical protein
MFSASAGVLTRVFTTIDAFRSIIEWSDSWPRDHTGRRMENQRISKPPLTVPTPIVGASQPGPRPPQPPHAMPSPNSPPPVKHGMAYTSIMDMDNF